MDTAGKPQPHSAEVIRERYLSKIGIIDAPAQPLPPPPSQLPVVREMPPIMPPVARGYIDKATASTAKKDGVKAAPAAADAEGPLASLSLTSCLGGVKPLTEPLKVCLDDDTSDEEDGGDCRDDDHDDDDYFLGIDHEDIEGLFKKRACIQFPPMSLPPQVPPPVPRSPTVAPVSSPPIPSAPVLRPMEAPSPLAMAAPLATAAAAASSASIAAAATVSEEGPTCVSEESSMASASTSSSLSSLRGAGRLSRSQLSQESLAGTKRKRTRRRVSLKADVAVVPIPRREEYSDRIKERLWSSAAELYRNAARNAVEFASEGWNWRNVTEDEDMLVHSVSGELVHPVHLQNVLQMNAEAEAGGTGEPLLPIPLRPNRPVGAAASSTAAASASEQSQSQSQTSSAPA